MMIQQGDDKSKALAPIEETLTTRRKASASVEQARDGREEHGLIDGVADNALVRLSELSRQRLSVQAVVNASGRALKEAGRKALKPVTPSRAPSNTPWAKLLRRIAMRGMADGLYRQNGELIMAGTSDNLLQLGVERGHDLSQLDAYAVRLKEGKLRGAKMAGADFRDSMLGAVDFSSANLEQASFARAKVLGWFKPGEYSWEHDTRQTSMSGAKLAGADFRKSKLIGVNFSRADLKGADFSGAKFDDFSIFKDRSDAGFAMVGSIFVISIPVFALTGMYKDSFKRERCFTSFQGADLEGTRFSVNAPFDKLKLSAAQRAEIVLVDRRGHVRDDLVVAEDGSLVLKDIGAEAKSDTPKLT